MQVHVTCGILVCGTDQRGIGYVLADLSATGLSPEGWARKVARAAPAAALFESGRAWFAGRFPALEDQLCGLIWDGGYHGPGRSPDRADAMVWALTELMLGPQAPEPRVRML